MQDDFDSYKPIRQKETEELFSKAKNDLEWAWSIIANAGSGRWEMESKDWQDAAARWRDNWYKTYVEKKNQDTYKEIPDMISVKETMEDLKSSKGCYSNPKPFTNINAPKDRSKVEILLVELSSLANALDTNLNRMEEKLAPIARPECTGTNDPEKSCKLEAIKAPIVMELESLILKFSCVNYRVLGLIERVEV